MKTGNLNFLEPSGPLQTCNGTALPLSFIRCYVVVISSTTPAISRKSFRYVGSSCMSHLFKFQFNNVTRTKVYTTNETSSSSSSFSSSSSIGTATPCGLWPAQLSLSILSRNVFTDCLCQRHVKPPTWRTSN